jgi:hypothetical protein
MIIENLEVSSFCNADCDWCGRKYMKREKKFISIDDVNKIGRLIEGKQNEIWLHFWGEPLLHPELFDIMFILKSYGVNSSFYTNGKMLDKEMINKLSISPIRTICVTMNRFNPQVLVEELAKKCRFQVRPVFVDGLPEGMNSVVSKKDFLKWCEEKKLCYGFEEYSPPFWGKSKKCFFKTRDGQCKLKLENKVNVDVNGKMVACVKDYDYWTYIDEVENINKCLYKNFECNCL